MKLTNKQVEDAMLAIQRFNPPVSFKCKMRLNRNLRKLTTAHEERMADQSRLVYTAMTDKSKKVETTPNGDVPLTPEEQLRFQPEREKLLKVEVDVEIHQIEIYDSSIGQIPEDADHSIDLSKDAKIPVAIPNDILSRLLDIVLVEGK